MGCGCRTAKQVVAATRIRDAAGRSGPQVSGDVCDVVSHGEQVAGLVARVQARPGMVLRRRLLCGCQVTVE